MVAQYLQELRSLLTRTLRDRHAAEDVAQESCVRVLEMQHAGKPVSNLRALLHSTAYHLVIDRSRRARVRHHEDLDALHEDAHPAAPQASQPDEALASRQRARALVQTIESLPPRCREAFVLYKFDGLSQAEIAARMGVSVNMVERHIMRGMDACRACRDSLDETAQGHKRLQKT